jgi:hypothetical protein
VAVVVTQVVDAAEAAVVTVVETVAVVEAGGNLTKQLIAIKKASLI